MTIRKPPITTTVKTSVAPLLAEATAVAIEEKFALATDFATHIKQLRIMWPKPPQTKHLRADFVLSAHTDAT